MSLGELNPAKMALMVCDLQEKFGPSIVEFETIVSNSARLIQSANVLQIPILVTEQYPKVSLLNKF